jgi:hypothetical protein
MRAAKTRISFVLYSTPTYEETITSTSIPAKYKEFQDVFEKKNADILPKHYSYNCTIDLQDRAQPSFGPIYNLLQND